MNETWAEHEANGAIAPARIGCDFTILSEMNDTRWEKRFDKIMDNKIILASRYKMLRSLL